MIVIVFFLESRNYYGVNKKIGVKYNFLQHSIVLFFCSSLYKKCVQNLMNISLYTARL